MNSVRSIISGSKRDERRDSRKYARASAWLRRRGFRLDANRFRTISRDETKHRRWVQATERRLRA